MAGWLQSRGFTSPVAGLCLALGLAFAPLAARAVVDGTSIPASQLAPGGAYQWLAKFFVGGGNGHCTGILVAPKAVLTAAHCAASLSSGVQVGDSATPIPVDAVAIHPGWDGASEFDVAILALSTASIAQPLAFVASPDGLAVGQLIRVAGWGVTSGNAAPAQGTMRIDQLAASFIYAVAEPSASCDGDSGGPLLVGQPGVDARLAGIASAGIVRTGPTGCADILAVRATGIADWVASIAGTSTGTNQSAPVVLGGSLATVMNVPVEIPMEFSDPDGVPMDFSNIVAADWTGGEITGCASASVPTTCTFQPAAGFVGTATFTYTVSDGARQATAHWTIEVKRDGPVVEIASRMFEEPAHGRRRVTVDIALSEPVAGPVTVTITPQDGSAVNGTDYLAKPDTVRIRAGQTRASYSFFILADKASEPVETFDLRLSAQGATPLLPAVTMFIDRNGPNLAPVVTLEGPLRVTTDERFDIVIDFHDPDGTPLDINNIVNAEWTNLELLSCGDELIPLACTFIAPEGFVGTASFSVTVSDGILETTAVWTVEVLPEP